LVAQVPYGKSLEPSCGQKPSIGWAGGEDEEVVQIQTVANVLRELLAASVQGALGLQVTSSSDGLNVRFAEYDPDGAFDDFGADAADPYLEGAVPCGKNGQEVLDDTDRLLFRRGWVLAANVNLGTVSRPLTAKTDSIGQVRIREFGDDT
jgi:hypothetical protein